VNWAGFINGIIKADELFSYNEADFKFTCSYSELSDSNSDLQEVTIRASFTALLIHIK
jgi:hypothetical protein